MSDAQTASGQAFGQAPHEFVDVHAHLADPVFDPDRAAVLERARAAGVVAILCVGETLADAERIVALAREHPLLRPCAGLYPTHLDLAAERDLAAFIREHRESLAAVGEIGLDHWKVTDAEGQALQEAIFRRQIQLALELDLPVNVHSRSAGRRAIEVLREEGATRVLLHAFDARPATAELGLGAGYSFSIPPSVVRSRQKEKLIARLPLSHLLLETDSPVLGVDPQERNEPAAITVGAAAIAAAKGVAIAEVARVTTANARALFRL
jgi:TatD DNase family protein